MEIYLLRALRVSRWRESLTRAAWQREGIVMIEYQHPQIGREYASCPHCHLVRHFSELDLYYKPKLPAAKPGSKPEIHKLWHTHEEQDYLCAAQICDVCGGVLFYVGNVLKFPPTRLPATIHPNIPDNLERAMKRAIQFKETAPDVASAMLRSVLHDLCKLVGMVDGMAYTDFLLNHPKASGDLIACFKEVCIDKDNVMQPGHIYPEEVNEIRRPIGLEYLINQVAAELLPKTRKQEA